MIPSQKQRRQAIACDWCRSHKVKCDAEQPSCRNCVRRGIECVTVNLRKPSLEGTRQLPMGRRRKDTPRTSESSSVTMEDWADMAAGSTGEPDTIKYPPSPQQPAQRAFETRLPSRILPGVFAAPFDEGMPGQTRESSQTDSPGSRSDSLATSSITLLTDRSSFQRQAISSGSSHSALVQWLDLFFSQCPTWTPILPFIQQGLAYSMEVPLPFSLALPPLPSHDRARKYAALFFSRIYPIFPVIERDVFEVSLDRLRAKLDSVPASLESRDYPLLASAYAIFSAAADEEAGSVSVDGTQYLQGAYFLYGHLVAAPYFTSVQALLLLALVLYNRSKDGASWGTLGQAIRIAQSIGLHRHGASAGTPATSATTGDENLHARIWWAAYTLERAMELEGGRPSAIHDDECDQIIPSSSVGTLPPGCSTDYFHALIRLAQIQARAISLLYGNKTQRKPVRALLCEMGRIDRALVDWANGFPESIRYGFVSCELVWM